MKAIDAVLEDLIDYAGLYAPAALDMRTAVQNYLDYGRNKNAAALGRFVVDITRLPDLRESAAEHSSSMRLTVVAPADAACNELSQFIDNGFSIESVEIKISQLLEIERVMTSIPSSVTAYFEVPVQADSSEALDAISALGGRAKLRMGGLVAEAFPTSEAIAHKLAALVERGVPFKATAGLHHPIRSRHPFTYASDSAVGTMHGFLNLICATALIYFGGETSDSLNLINEEDPGAFKVAADTISWRSFQWSTDQLREVRQKFFLSFGSCSFVEPMRDLEARGWL